MPFSENNLLQNPVMTSQKLFSFLKVYLQFDQIIIETKWLSSMQIIVVSDNNCKHFQMSHADG